MIVFVGPRRLGTVFAVGNARVETEFFCVNFLPIFPQRSRFVVAAYGDTAEVDHPIPLVPISVLAGYLRSWGLIASVFAMARGIFGDPPAAPVNAVFIVLGLALVLLTWWAWIGLGEPSADDAARWKAYAAYARFPLDVALLDGDAAARLREQLAADLAERAPALLAGTYRTAPDPARDWAAIALHPDVRDPELLRAALTLARLESTKGDARSRATFARTHDAIWAKLKALAPASEA